MYDPTNGRMLSVDNFVQDPYSTQGYNRYSYALNNPLKYTDPDGENPTLIALAIGAMANLIFQSVTGNINSFGDIGLSLLVGAAAGAAGYGAGLAVSAGVAAATTTGAAIANGAIAGFVGGFAGGFVGGAGNAWMNGASFDDGMFAGFLGGAIGGLSGALIGGITNGIRYKIAENKFKLLYIENHGSLDGYGSPLRPSTAEAQRVSDSYFNKFIFKDSSRLVYDPNYNMPTTQDGRVALGETDRFLTNGKYIVHIGERAFSSEFILFNTIGHEYVHVAHLNLYPGISREATEYGAHFWNREMNRGTRDNWVIKNIMIEQESAYIEDFYPAAKSFGIDKLILFREWGLPSSLPINFK